MNSPLKILGLSPKAAKVLEAVIQGISTPLEISRVIKISRPAIYYVLNDLRQRGLVRVIAEGGKKIWRINDSQHIEKSLYELKRSVLSFKGGKEEVLRKFENVTIHRGSIAVKEVMTRMFVGRKNERFVAFQGDKILNSWKRNIGLKDIDTINRAIKENHLIVDAILPKNFFDEAVEQMGASWAKEFEGRATRVTEIGNEYFDHKAEAFLFREALYLISMEEKVVIEVRNSEIQKMFKHLLEFIQDSAPTIDANEVLRELVSGRKT